MISHGILKETTFHSVIGEWSIVKPASERHKRSVYADLLLTALIDAFSILVIFLLMSFSSSGDLLDLKGTDLPRAAKGEVLERNPVVKVEEGKIFLEEKLLTADTLTEALLDVRKKFLETHPGQEFPGALTIQGDRKLKYETLNGIVLASSQAGFSDIKFAVIMR